MQGRWKCKWKVKMLIFRIMERLKMLMNNKINKQNTKKKNE